MKMFLPFRFQSTSFSWIRNNVTQLILRLLNWSALPEFERKAHGDAAPPVDQGVEVHKGQLLRMRGALRDTGVEGRSKESFMEEGDDDMDDETEDEDDKARESQLEGRDTRFSSIAES